MELKVAKDFTTKLTAMLKDANGLSWKSGAEMETEAKVVMSGLMKEKNIG